MPEKNLALKPGLCLLKQSKRGDRISSGLGRYSGQPFYVAPVDAELTALELIWNHLKLKSVFIVCHTW